MTDLERVTLAARKAVARAAVLYTPMAYEGLLLLVEELTKITNKVKR